MQLACPLTRGTAGRSLPISSCYTGSAGSPSRSKHGLISPRPTRPFPSHFGRTAARTAPYRVGQWLWLSAWHCSTAQRCVLCDCGLWSSTTGFARSRYAAATSSRAEPRPLAFECDVNAAAGGRVQPPDAMPWHYCRCSWLVCSLEGLEVALCPSAAAVQSAAGVTGIRRDELKNVYIAYPDVPGSGRTCWGIENFYF